MTTLWATNIDWNAVAAMLSSGAAVVAIVLSQSNSSRSLKMAERQLSHAHRVHAETQEAMAARYTERNLAAVSAGVRALRAVNSMREPFLDPQYAEARVPPDLASRTGFMLQRHAEKIEAISPLEISATNGVQLADLAEQLWMQGDMLRTTERKHVTYKDVLAMLMECEDVALNTLISVQPPIPVEVFVEYGFVDEAHMTAFLQARAASDARDQRDS